MRLDGASCACVLLRLSTLVSPSSPTSEDVHCTAVNPYSPVAFRTIKVVSYSCLNWNTFSTIVTIKPTGAMLQRIVLASSGVFAAAQLMRRLSRSSLLYLGVCICAASHLLHLHQWWHYNTSY